MINLLEGSRGRGYLVPLFEIKNQNFFVFMVEVYGDGISHIVCVILLTLKEQSTLSVPKWLSYLPDFLVPNDCPVYLPWREIRGSKSNVFAPNVHHQEVLRYHNFRGRFGVVVVFYCKSHAYNYLVNGQWALISPKWGTRTIVLGQRGITQFLVSWDWDVACYIVISSMKSIHMYNMTQLLGCVSGTMYWASIILLWRMSHLCGTFRLCIVKFSSCNYKFIVY